jgi:hypothetical protein
MKRPEKAQMNKSFMVIGLADFARLILGENTMKYVSSSFVALGMFASILGSTTAQAANRYGVVCLHNKTDTPINFTVKTGNGPWELYTLEPDTNLTFWNTYEYQNQNRSPIFEVRFDSDLSEGSYYLQYRLERRAAEGNSCSEGKQYAFKYEPGNQDFIDLKALW